MERTSNLDFEERLKMFCEVLSDFQDLRQAGLEQASRVAKDVISEWSVRFAEQKKRNRIESVQFNPLAQISIKEIDHSAILGNLLNPEGNHGQGRLFLNAFLQSLKVPNPELGDWVVTVEVGRIDILLRRKEPEAVVIIENKLKGAQDGKHQLYRYWYREIFPLRSFSNSSDPANDKSFRIIYLTPDDHHLPSAQTSKAPNGFKDEMRTNREVMTIRSLLDKWLPRVRPEIDAGNYRLNTFLDFYEEIWK